MSSHELASKYEARKAEIKKRLAEFKRVFSEGDERVFEELAFCLCTPQSKATASWTAISSLKRNGLLYKGTAEQIRPFLNTVRFNETKSRRIVEARERFARGGKVEIRKLLLDKGDPRSMRDWLVENVNGFGPKEASHFLRNIGFGADLGILDSHILKNLAKFGVIEGLPKSMTHRRYYEIEAKMRDFAAGIGIPFDELDLLLWSEETGMIFK